MSDISVKIPNLENQKSIADSLSKIAGIQSNINGIVRSLMSDYWKTIYPIGSIYVSTNGTSPSELFGGTWERIYNRFLWAGAEWKTIGKDGSTASFTLKNVTTARFGDPDSDRWTYFNLDAGDYTFGSAVSKLNGYDPLPQIVKTLQIMDSTGTSEIGNLGGEYSHKLTVDEMPNHNHPIELRANASGQTGGSAWFVDAGTYGSKHNGTKYQSDYVGVGQSHNNMPPFLSVYMWKRTE